METPASSEDNHVQAAHESDSPTCMVNGNATYTVLDDSIFVCYSSIHHNLYIY
jgi:hypothetical protein